MDKKELKIEELHKKTEAPDFWNDQMGAQKVLQRIKTLSNVSETWKEVFKKSESVDEFIQIAQMENDDSLFNDIANELESLDKSINDAELRNMLSGKDDNRNCILTINSGAGGTEAQDWAEMLMRMYIRYGEKNKLKVSLVDRLDGDGAGIKSATLELTGEYAYGYLKAENGVHRLVRISPFDANKKKAYFIRRGFCFSCD